jgi:NADPH2:quinone reductase
VLVIEVAEFGGPEVLRLRQQPDPVAGPDKAKQAAAGVLRPIIGQRFALADAARAHAAIEARDVFGRTLLIADEAAL